jgi:hypothetical protein
VSGRVAKAVHPRNEDMVQQKEAQLPEERRKEIFAALVDAQDQEMGVPQSRKAIAERFGLSDAQLRQIEREGVDEQWPPL